MWGSKQASQCTGMAFIFVQTEGAKDAARATS